MYFFNEVHLFRWLPSITFKVILVQLKRGFELFVSLMWYTIIQIFNY